MNTNVFKQYVDDFIKNNLEDEKEKNKKFTYLMWIFACVAIISAVAVVIFIVTTFTSERNFEMNEAIIMFILFAVGLLSTSGLFYFKKRSVSTTPENVKRVMANLPNFVSKYLEVMVPDIKTQKFELKEFGGSYSELIIGNALFSCDANIEEIIRYEHDRDMNGKSTTKAVHYFVNTLMVHLNYKPINIVDKVEIKLGKTKGKDIDQYISESMEFNDTYKVVSNKEDGFNLLTPVRIETLLNKKQYMKNVDLNVTKTIASFQRHWEVEKTYNRHRTLASKPLTIMSADDKKMSLEIIKHIHEIVTNPLDNLAIMKLFLLHN